MRTVHLALVGLAMSGKRTLLCDAIGRIGRAVSPLTFDPASEPILEWPLVELRVGVSVLAARSSTAYATPETPNLPEPLVQDLHRLRRADGVIFVADSQQARQGGNVEQLERLRSDLHAWNRDIDTIPVVFALNKRDLPDIADVRQLRATLSSANSRHVEVIATRGQGTVDVFSSVLAMLA
jgi:hypothetical protein